MRRSAFDWEPVTLAGREAAEIWSYLGLFAFDAEANHRRTTGEDAENWGYKAQTARDLMELLEGLGCGEDMGDLDRRYARKQLYGDWKATNPE